MKPLSIVSKGTTKKNEECRKMIVVENLFIFELLGELYENYHYRADFAFKLRIIKVF
jgi:hypothetical protein